MWRRRVAAAILALTLGLFSACDSVKKTPSETDSEFLAKAQSLLKDALDVLYLYQGEVAVDKSGEAYRITPTGHRYYPVIKFNSLAELREHSRKVFTEDFCATVLDPWAGNPKNPKFLEHEGRLWYTNDIGNMGWLNSLIPETIESVSTESGRHVVSVYSQSQLMTVERQEFIFVYEDSRWQLDNYYHFNRKDPITRNPSVMALLTEKEGGKDTLYGLTVTTPGGKPLTLPDNMVAPFQSLLGALEYLPDSVEKPDALPECKGNTTVMELTLYSGSYLLTQNGNMMYITAPDGQITALRLQYLGGMVLLQQLTDAAKWNLKKF